MKRCYCVAGKPRKIKAVYDYVYLRIINLYYGCECDTNNMRWSIEKLAATFNISK